MTVTFLNMLLTFFVLSVCMFVCANARYPLSGFWRLLVHGRIGNIGLQFYSLFLFIFYLSGFGILNQHTVDNRRVSLWLLALVAGDI